MKPNDTDSIADRRLRDQDSFAAPISSLPPKPATLPPKPALGNYRQNYPPAPPHRATEQRNYRADSRQPRYAGRDRSRSPPSRLGWLGDHDFEGRKTNRPEGPPSFYSFDFITPQLKNEKPRRDENASIGGVDGGEINVPNRGSEGIWTTTESNTRLSNRMYPAELGGRSCRSRSPQRGRSRSRSPFGRRETPPIRIRDYSPPPRLVDASPQRAPLRSPAGRRASPQRSIRDFSRNRYQAISPTRRRDPSGQRDGGNLQPRRPESPPPRPGDPSAQRSGNTPHDGSCSAGRNIMDHDHRLDGLGYTFRESSRVVSPPAARDSTLPTRRHRSTSRRRLSPPARSRNVRDYPCDGSCSPGYQYPDTIHSPFGLHVARPPRSPPRRGAGSYYRPREDAPRVRPSYYRPRRDDRSMDSYRPRHDTRVRSPAKVKLQLHAEAVRGSGVGSEKEKAVPKVMDGDKAEEEYEW
jgi:hypothetical protein